VRARSVRALAIGFAFLGATHLIPPRVSHACATCSCGDPTLTTMGNEKPLAGRLRASIDLRYRTDAVGEPRIDEVELREERIDLALTWAPLERLFLGVMLPVSYRDITYVNLARQRVVGLADAELRAKYYFYQDRSFAPRHLLAVQVGAELPTAGTQRDRNGAALPSEAQLGTGGLDPILGASYGYFREPWSAYVSATVVLPTDSRAGIEPGRSLLGTAAGQYQIDVDWAARLGVDTRVDQRSHNQGSGDEPDSGGFIAFLSPELVFSPTTDLIVSASVRVPVVNRLSGFHDEGLIAQTAITYDF
jgi:hypothetical protein